MKWEILSRQKTNSPEDIVKVLLKNRGIKDKKEFFSPESPGKIKLESLGVSKVAIRRAIKRIKEAKKKKEDVIVYGDYDADGICATAIVWEALHEFGVDVLPHIPDRFEEGYGLNAVSIENVKLQMPNLKLIVTVDNGIVAYGGIKKAKELGIDVVVIDHHAKGQKKNLSLSVLHSTSVCGSALAWFFAGEIGYKGGLELAAIGTIADQMPLTGVNRSLVKFGLAELNKTKRLGLKALFSDARIENAGTYEVNYIIAPRINAMGRLAQGIDSLRLLCTRREDKARELSKTLDRTNFERQRIVDKVVLHARSRVGDQKVIILADESYHEGVIGLAAGKLVEEFYRPAIVFSKKDKISKASARSISGFNIIENIRKLSSLYLEGGGHPMAAGFSIETEKINLFAKKINEISKKLLTAEVLEKKLKIDTELSFSNISWDLVKTIVEFEPFGLGNPAPTFVTRKAVVLDVRAVGRESKHLKLKLKQNEHIFDAIYFGGGEIYPDLKLDAEIAIAYRLEENLWNGQKTLQLVVKDVLN